MSEMHHRESIIKAQIYIESHLDEGLSLEKIAKVVHISPYYFHRLFQAHTGKSLGDYIKNVRLNRATKQLCYFDTPITNIAFEAGYESSSSFTKAFHRKLGVSPREYRRDVQRHLLERTHKIPSKTQWIAETKPEVVYRKEERVLFLRLIGDYKTTIDLGFKQLHSELLKKNLLPHIKYCYGIALDDPLTVEREKCRFDLCVNLAAGGPVNKEIGEKIISGGHYAVFTCSAPFSKLEEIFTSLFYLWHQKYKHQLRTSNAFCQYLNVQEDMAHFSEKIVTAKYHVPLIK